MDDSENMSDNNTNHMSEDESQSQSNYNALNRSNSDGDGEISGPDFNGSQSQVASRDFESRRKPAAITATVTVRDHKWTFKGDPSDIATFFEQCSANPLLHRALRDASEGETEILATTRAKQSQSKPAEGRERGFRTPRSSSTGAFTNTLPTNTEVRCGNCDRVGHEIKQCIGPLTLYGFIDGCPYRNVTGHILEACSEFSGDKRELAKVMLAWRQNRPPLKCTINPWDHALVQRGALYADIRPWPTDQSIIYPGHHKGYWKTYVYQPHAKDDKPLQISLVYDPAELNWPIRVC